MSSEQFAHAILELDYDNENEREEISVPEQLIKEYQDLNEKLDQALLKIKNKRKKSIKLKK